MKKQSIIVFLIFLFIIQAYYIYRTSYAGYMFHVNYKVERTNVDYIVLSYNLSYIKDIILNQEKSMDGKVIGFFFKDNSPQYTIGEQYYYNIRNFYPMVMSVDSKKTLSEFSDESFLKSMVDNKNDYVVLIGKGSKILNIETEKDISLYQVINNQLHLIGAYDNTLFNLREMQEKYHHDYYDITLKFIQNYIDSYQYEYGYTAYEYLYQYANDLIKNNEEMLAVSFYQQYLNLPSYNADVVFHKARIYNYLKDEENFLRMLDYCST